jgi:hypothetical protein
MHPVDNGCFWALTMMRYTKGFIQNNQITRMMSFEAINRLFHVSLKWKQDLFVGIFCLGDTGMIPTRRAGSKQNSNLLVRKARSANWGSQKWNGQGVVLPVGRCNEWESRKFESWLVKYTLHDVRACLWILVERALLFVQSTFKDDKCGD